MYTIKEYSRLAFSLTIFLSLFVGFLPSSTGPRQNADKSIDVLSMFPVPRYDQDLERKVSSLFAVDNPIPVLNSISPSQKVAGDGSFDMVLDGSDFTLDSRAWWNGTQLTTSYVNETQLKASIPSFLIRNEGVGNITVSNPAPGGGVSSALPFAITPRTSTWMAHSPEGGIIWDIEVDPNNSSVIYAGTSAAGIYKSLDGGQSWIAINNGIDSPYINAVAVNPANSSIIMAGSGGFGTYLSQNGGAFWSKVWYAGPSNVNCIKFDPQDQNKIYVGTGQGLFRTDDGGQTWHDIVGSNFGDTPASYILQVAVDGQHSGTVYVVDSPVKNGVPTNTRSVWKTTNDGKDWVELSFPGTAESIVRSLAIDPTNSNILYAGTEYAQGSADSGLYKSQNGGSTWTKVIPSAGYYFNIVFSNSDPSYIYVATSGAVQVSSDGGQTWQSGGSSDIMTLDVDPANPLVLYGAGYHGAFKSLDAATTWSPINSGLTAQLITGLVYSSQSTTLFAPTWTGGLWNSTDYGATWNQLGLGQGYLSIIIMDPIDQQHLLVGYGSSLSETTDSGQTWTPRFINNPVNTITFAANSDLYYGTNPFRVLKSTDDGNTWVEKSNGLPSCPADSIYCFVGFLTSDPVDPKVIYTGLISGRQDPQLGDVRTGHVYKTINGGDNWIEIDNGITNGYLTSLTIDPLNTSTLFLGTNYGVFKSADGGTHWMESDSGLSSQQVNVIAVDPTNDQIVYVGTEGQGVFRSLDGGVTWVGFNYGMASGYVRGLVVIPPALQEPANSSLVSRTVKQQSQLSRLYSITGGQVYAYFSVPILFTDVIDTYWAISWINRLYNAGITGGCSSTPLQYCPDSNVTRDQMAVFLERGMHGSSFNPPTVPLTFTDTSGNFAQYWIEALKSDGITSGCGSNLYCPSDPTTRAQMAVFLLKSEHGANYIPASPTGTMFTDVPGGYWAASWIEQLANEGITSGCGGGNYCPDQPVTRAQMAVFLAKTFNLP